MKEHDWKDIDEDIKDGVWYIHFICDDCKQHAYINQDTGEDTLKEATEFCPGL